MEEESAMSAPLAAPPVAWAEPGPIRQLQLLLSRVATMCLVELQKLRRDRSELITRAVQPALWLLIFGETFTRLHAIPTGSTPYLAYLAPGILAQSALFVSIFYGIQIIWERDAGVLAKLLVTPTPRAALVAGKAFAAGLRALVQAVIVLITMPLFFASNALYPVNLMPGWLKVLNHVNPLSYEVDALRGLLIGTPARLWLDFVVLIGAAAVAIGVASALLGRLAR
jgi:ABC-2 type transport system permease protein